jgi:FkbM family methyltransferase
MRALLRVSKGAAGSMKTERNIAGSFARLNLLSVWRRKLTVWGCPMAAPSLDRLVCLALHRVGWLGKAERSLFQRWIRPGMVVIDVGANLGIYSLLLSRLVGSSGSVIAFEPEPDMFEALACNCKRNGAENIVLVNQALGSMPGTALLSRSLLHGGDNRLAPGHKTGFRKLVPVQVVTLDEVIGQRPVDFIKIDVQGWEGEVFRGMEGVLANNPNLQIYFEFWPRGLTNAGCDPAELLSRLSGRGFHLAEQIKGELKALRSFAEIGKALRGHRFVNVYASRPQTASVS